MEAEDIRPPTPIRVVLADPHTVTLQGTRQVLEQDPGLAVVGTTGHGSEALAMAHTLAPHVLMTEVQLLDVSGLSMAQQLTDTPVRVLILSAYCEDHHLRELIHTEVAGYILKESTPQEIVEAVYAVARGQGGWFSARVVQQMLRLRKKETVLEACHITSREQEVLRLVASGHDNTAIATRISTAVGTVKNHLTRIYIKLGVRSRAEAIVWARINEVV